MRFILTIAAIFVDNIVRYWCYSTKMYGGYNRAQRQALTEVMNTLNSQQPSLEVRPSDSLLALPRFAKYKQADPEFEVYSALMHGLIISS